MRRLALASTALAAILVAPGAPAQAASAYAACLHQADVAGCIALRVAPDTPLRPWPAHLSTLVRSGAPAATAAYLERIHPFTDIIRESRINPSAADLDALALIDPEAVAAIRPNATESDWRGWSEAHAGVYASRPLPAAARAGYLLATAAYATPDPFAEALAGAALSAAGAEASRAYQVAMAAVSGLNDPDPRAFDVVPPGAKTILARAVTAGETRESYWLDVAGFALWLGERDTATLALGRLPATPRTGRGAAREISLWTGAGKPEEAERRLGAAPGGEQSRLSLQVAQAWLTSGDRKRAKALAMRALAAPETAPGDRVALIALLAQAGATAPAAAAAQALSTEARWADAASLSLALAAASQAESAAGLKREGCALARRAISQASASAAAQLQAWNGRYHADAPLNVWLGRDFTDTGVSLEDLRQSYRERGLQALADCGEGAPPAGQGWASLASVFDPNASRAVQLREAADAVAGDPARAGRLLASANAAPAPGDAMGQALWRSGLAAAAAVAGDASAAQGYFAEAVRALDGLGNPDEQRAAALALARDGRLLALRLSGGLHPARPDLNLAEGPAGPAER